MSVDSLCWGDVGVEALGSVSYNKPGEVRACVQPHVFINTSSAPPPAYPHPMVAGCGLSSRGAQDPFLSSQQSPRTVVLKIRPPLTAPQSPGSLLDMQMFRCNPRPADQKLQGWGPAPGVLTSPLGGGSSPHSSLRTSHAQARQASREEEGVAPVLSPQQQLGSCSSPRLCPTPSLSDAISCANYSSKSGPGLSVIFRA